VSRECPARRQSFASGLAPRLTHISAPRSEGKVVSSRRLKAFFFRLLARKPQECAWAKRNDTAQDASAGLRTAVLGANDGILSTSSLVLGVAAAHATRHNLLIAGIAGLGAGAMSMAAGEYVSVYSQADTEHADLELERAELVDCC
jgi:hypothetical protein